MQEQLPVCICLVHSLIEKIHLRKLVNKKLDPSVVSMSLHHNEEDLELKSPVITNKDGLRSFISLKRFSKLDKNKSNSLLF